MIYIKFLLHTDYSGNVLTDPIRHEEFKKGTLAYFDPYNKMIFIDQIPVCRYNSQTAKEYFCRDDDNQGWLRYKYIYAIAYSNRQRIHSDGAVSRFTEDEAGIIKNKWKHFIMQDCPEVILFNANFFNATIEDLKQLAEDVHIKVKLDNSSNSIKKNNVDSNIKDSVIKNDKIKIINNVVIKK